MGHWSNRPDVGRWRLAAGGGRVDTRQFGAYEVASVLHPVFAANETALEEGSPAGPDGKPLNHSAAGSLERVGVAVPRDHVRVVCPHHNPRRPVRALRPGRRRHQRRPHRTPPRRSGAGGVTCRWTDRRFAGDAARRSRRALPADPDRGGSPGELHRQRAEHQAAISVRPPRPRRGRRHRLSGKLPNWPKSSRLRVELV